jgi:hypothetical protein
MLQYALQHRHMAPLFNPASWIRQC